MHDVDLGLGLQKLTGEVRGSAVPARGVADLARIGLGKGNELAQRPHRQARIDVDHIGLRAHECDRCKVLGRIEADLLIEADIGRQNAVGAKEQRVAIRRRARHHLAGDIAARAGTVLDHDRLADDLLELARDQARHHIARPAGRKSKHHCHRACRIVGGPRERRQQRKQRSNDQGCPWHVEPPELYLFDVIGRRPIRAQRHRGAAPRRRRV